MKKFRSKEKGPLPVRLLSDSISVASKGYFMVGDEDMQSPDLLKKIRQGLVEPVKEDVKKSVPVLSEQEPVEDSNIESVAECEGPVDVIGDEKHDDSLTMSLEMVESESSENGSGDAVSVGQGDESTKPKSGRRTKNKRGITG